MKRVIAIACADIHLCHNPPTARSAEPDWYAAQERVLSQIRELQQEHNGVPFLVAGDLFHTPEPPPKLIEFAFEKLPDNVYAVPGQHDMKNWRRDSLKGTAFGLLKTVGRIKEPFGGLINAAGTHFCLHGFGWGAEDSNLNLGECTNVVLSHEFVYGSSSDVPWSDGGRAIWSAIKKFNDADIVIFGDHHRTAIFRDGANRIKGFNSGAIIRRNINERHHTPKVALIHDGGGAEIVHLCTAEDVWTDTRNETRETRLSPKLAEELKRAFESGAKLGDAAVKFSEAAKGYGEDIQRLIERFTQDEERA